MLEAEVETGGLYQQLQLALEYRMFFGVYQVQIWAQKVRQLQQPAHLPGGHGRTVPRPMLAEDQHQRLLGLVLTPEPPKLQTSGLAMAGTFSEQPDN